MIEEIILNYLRESGFPCYLSVPEEPSGNFVVLDKTGSDHDEGLFHATLAVRLRKDSSAAQLNHHVVQAMLDADTCLRWSAASWSPTTFSRHHLELPAIRAVSAGALLSF
ncbi:MAG: hypothetical protein ACLUIR_03080 [Faecalibacterium prausnitzii]